MSCYAVPLQSSISRHDFSEQLPLPAEHKNGQNFYPENRLGWNVVICALRLLWLPEVVKWEHSADENSEHNRGKG